jgi:hypothetical protein
MTAMTHDTKHDPEHARAEDIQHARYGGMHFGAAFFGWLVAISIGALLTALLAALGGTIALTATDSASELTGAAETIGLLGAIGLLAVMALAYYAGGYVAGRMSRFDGVRQGIAVWLIGIMAAVVLALAGLALNGSYNLLQQLNLPAIPVDGQSFTAGGLMTTLAILVASLLAAMAGGRLGENYHRKVDEAGYADDANHAHHLTGGRWAHHH